MRAAAHEADEEGDQRKARACEQKFKAIMDLCGRDQYTHLHRSGREEVPSEIHEKAMDCFHAYRQCTLVCACVHALIWVREDHIAEHVSVAVCFGERYWERGGFLL